jgi:hypothetical protein
VAKIRERPAVNKQGLYRFCLERFNLKNLKAVQGKEKYCVEVLNRSAALEDLDAKVKIETAWEMMRENIKISVKKSQGYYK